METNTSGWTGSGAYIRWMVFVIFSFFTGDAIAQIEITEVRYSGTIGSSAIVLTFEIPSRHYNEVHGSYYYTQYRKNIVFKDEEGVFEGPVKLTEYYNGKPTGYFRFRDLDGFDFPSSLSGKWYSMDGQKSYPVSLRRIN